MRLALPDRVLELEPGRPLLMGIVNATPDSFSDPPGGATVTELAARARRLVAAGAAIVDVGGESGRTDRRAVDVDEEIARVVPLVEQLVGDGLTVSVDTWRAEVAGAALAAGAAMINDVSGLCEPALGEHCARTGAALVITHTRAAPKEKSFPGYDDPLTDVVTLLSERAEVARAVGVRDDQLLLDPGIDLAKTPAESVTVLRRLDELYELGRPLLLAISRKDFLGAVTGRLPAERDAATLAAIEPALDAPAAVLRVHDVKAATDFLRVRAVLRGDAEPPAGVLSESLRRERAVRRERAA